MADDYAFDAIPERAKRDRDLKLSDWRALAAIASHDRRSLLRDAGAGCYAGARALAAAANTDPKTMREAITRLIERGYVVQEAPPPGRQGRVLRIVYGGGTVPPTGEGTAPPTSKDRSAGTVPPTGEGTVAREVGGPWPPRTEEEAETETYSVETDARERARSDDFRNVIAFPGRPARGELADLVMQAIPIAGSQAKLARRAGVGPQHVTAAKQGILETSRDIDHIADECRRLIAAADRSEPIEPIPLLPEQICGWLPRRFDRLVRPHQIEIVSLAIDRAMRRSGLDPLDRSLLLDWLTWSAKRTDYEPTSSRIDQLIQRLTERTTHARPSP